MRASTRRCTFAAASSVDLDPRPDPRAPHSRVETSDRARIALTSGFDRVARVRSRSGKEREKKRTFSFACRHGRRRGRPEPRAGRAAPAAVLRRVGAVRPLRAVAPRAEGGLRAPGGRRAVVRTPIPAPNTSEASFQPTQSDVFAPSDARPARGPTVARLLSFPRTRLVRPGSPRSRRRAASSPRVRPARSPAATTTARRLARSQCRL